MLTAVALSMTLPLNTLAISAVGADLPLCCVSRDAAVATISLVSQPPAGAGAAVQNDPDVEQLLDELELAAGNLQAFTATLTYQSYEDLLGRRETRTGEIIYRIDSVTGDKSFAVLFNRLVVGDRLQNRSKHYVFNDRWLAEIDHENKQFIKREMVPPGRSLDPLKLGEGPIPLPIGQPKHEVLARFTVSPVEAPQEGLLAGLTGVDGIRLVPRENTSEARDYQYVDLYYDRENRLPVGINAVELNDNVKTVRLRDVQHNPKLTEDQLQQLSVDEPDPREWAIDRRPWRGES